MKLTPVRTLLLLGAGYALYRATKSTSTPVAGQGGYIGDLADAAPTINVTPDISADKLQALSDSIKQKLIESAAAQSAIQLTLYISLQAYPVVGQCVTALLAVVQAAGSAYEKRKIQEITDNLRDRINALGTTYTIKYRTLRDKVFEEEAATVKATLTGHNMAPMAGMGDFWSKAKDVAEKVVKPIAMVTSKSIMIPMKLSEKATMKTIEVVAKAVGAKHVAQEASTLEQKTSAQFNQAETKLTKDLTDPIKTAGVIGRTVTGEQAVFDARDKCNQIYADAAAQMEKDYQTFVTNINNPAFRTALRNAMLADPSAFSQLDDVTKQLNAASNLKIMVGAGLAAAAGLFMFKR